MAEMLSPAAKRVPKDAKAKELEPLLQFKTRALVHFAVSTDEVFMTMCRPTKLDGLSRVFQYQFY